MLPPKVVQVEVKMTNFLVQHNIPLSIADDLGLLFRNIFTDSQISKTFASGRTKTTCILNNAIAPHFTSTYYCTDCKNAISIHFFNSFTCGSNV